MTRACRALQRIMSVAANDFESRGRPAIASPSPPSSVISWKAKFLSIDS